MTNLTRRHAPIVLFAAVLLVVGTAGGAAAAKLITGKDVKNSSLTGKDIKNGSLGANELSKSAKTALKGTVGAPGTPGISGYENVLEKIPVDADSTAGLTLAYCPRGKKALGGGAYFEGFSPARTISSAGPFKATYLPDGTPSGYGIATSTDASGWGASGRNESPNGTYFYVWVTCANVS
jgi:hypothetical protein